MGHNYTRKKDKPTNANEEAIDRISDLPEVIIHHILSFLLTKEAARMSGLSKSMLQAWSTCPFLDFDQIYFGLIPYHKINNTRVENALLKLVNDTIKGHYQLGVPIQKFRLHINTITPSKFAPLMRDWLRTILHNGVLELDLDMMWEGSDLPQEIFEVKSLQVLKVTSKNFRYKLVLGSTGIKCLNLKKLELERVAIDASTFRNITCSCPLIEDLSLKDCGLSEIYVADFHNLRLLLLECLGAEWVHVSAPNLQSLIFRGAGMLNIGACGNLKVLSISDSPIVDEQLQKILSTNPRVEDLSLFSCTMLQRVHFSSSFLKHLNLSRCRKLLEAVIGAPNLQVLEYHYMPRSPLPVTSPAENAESKVSIYCGGDICVSWFHEIREFLKKFRKSSVEITSYRDVKFDYEGVRAIRVRHGHEVENLTVYYEQSVSLTHLDGLFCMCHPKTVVCEYADTFSNHGLIKSFCKELMNWRNLKCCNLDVIKCWRHYIKNAEFQFEGDYQKPLGLIRSNQVSLVLEWQWYD